MADPKIEANDTLNPCPHCGAENRIGELVCHSCGKPLKSEISPQTKKLQSMLERPSRPRPPSARETHFPAGRMLSIRMNEVQEPLVYSLDNGSITIGRHDKHTNFTPEVDFYPYAGYLLGVSRKHAMFHRVNNQLFVEDLGSSNGTYVDNEKVPAFERKQLYSGAEVRLGDLHFTVHF